MNKKTIITILLALVAVAGQGQVKCHVVGTVAEGTTPIELRIYRDGEDPKDSKLRPVVKDGHFECDVEDAQIERRHHPLHLHRCQVIGAAYQGCD